MKTFKFTKITETIVRAAKIEISIDIPIEFSKYNIKFSYYCENCYGSGCENTDRANEGCDNCSSTGRVSKILPMEQLSTIIDSENLKQLKNTLIAMETLIE